MSMNLLPLLLLTLTTTTLVLRSGDRISVDDGVAREENGVVTFRSGGTLYSLPAAEIERTVSAPETAAAPSTPEERRARLAVSEEMRKRLIEELEKNHGGTPVAPPAMPESLLTPVNLNNEDEWSWRRQARAHEETIRRANEELQLLETRAKELQSKIYTLLALGFKPHAFTYDSSLLVRTQDQIPYAKLEVERATRAFTEFREEARRRGVMPGWLR